MTTAFIGLVIMTLARDVGNRIFAGERLPHDPQPKGRFIDRAA